MDQSVQRYFSRGASGLLVAKVPDGRDPVEPLPQPVPDRPSRVERQDGGGRDVDVVVLYVIGGLVLVATVLSMAS